MVITSVLVYQAKNKYEEGEKIMCATCGCGYATYDDLETGAPGNEVKNEK